MNTRLVAIILIVLGVVVVGYSGITFRTRGEPVDIGPIHLETTQRHFIPPLVGVIALVGGLVLWFGGDKKKE